MRNYVRLETQKITREPQGGRSYWFLLLAGCFIAFVGAFLFVSSPGEQVQRFFAAGQAGVGVGMALTATAELLPKDRRKPAAVLRTLALTALALGAAGATAVFFG